MAFSNSTKAAIGLFKIRHDCETSGSFSTWFEMYSALISDIEDKFLALTATAEDAEWFTSEFLIVKNGSGADYFLTLGGEIFKLSNNRTYAMRPAEVQVLQAQLIKDGLSIGSIGLTDLSTFVASGHVKIFTAG